MWLLHLAQAGAHFLQVRLGLFNRGELAALVELVEVNQHGESLLGPALRGAENLFRKNRASGRHIDFIGGKITKTLPVQARASSKLSSQNRMYFHWPYGYCVDYQFREVA